MADSRPPASGIVCGWVFTSSFLIIVIGWIVIAAALIGSRVH